MRLTNEDIEQIKIWIAALRSGEYKQGRMMLQSLDNTYCCLGVACKVLIPHDKLKLYHDGVIAGSTPHEQSNAPEWLKRIDGEFGRYWGDSLVYLNDTGKYTFEWIADMLEHFINLKKPIQNETN